MTRIALQALHALARRHARKADEADDLVQSALLAAVEAGRTDLAAADTQRWLAGVIRNQAKMGARTAVRRRRRDDAWSSAQQGELTTDDAAPAPRNDASPALSALSPALRVTALLALNGCTREEIGWLLGLSDAALRQRISQLRKALAGAEPPPSGSRTGASDSRLAYGRIRQHLLPAARRDGVLASHDPDGHLFLVAPSQTARRRQQAGG
jgi:RNA polymerase sigma factor (sigma-70 family)